MKTFNFKKMDAFTDGSSGGNPAAGIFLDALDDISENQMQQIALELKGFVNEVAYVAQIDNSTFQLRYFSSEREVEFCGHATIAVMYDLISHDSKLLAQDSLTIVTNQATLRIENRVETEGAVLIASPPPRFTTCEIEQEKIGSALKISTESINASLPTDIINAGLQTLVVPISSLNELLAISPNEGLLKAFCEDNNLDIIIVFSQEVTTSQNAYRSRVFAPTFGYLEDPATGSGNAALGHYLLKQQLWDGKVISVEQNALRDNYNTIKLLAQVDSNKNMQVVFGGQSVTKLTGEYILH